LGAVIVLNLACESGHEFEGWFGSASAFESQLQRAQVSCPECGTTGVERRPSAPYVQTRSAAVPMRRHEAAPPKTDQQPAAPTMDAAVAQFVATLRLAARQAEDVGERFATEARRIHQGEAAQRQIKGRASADEVRDLIDDGIAVLPVPPDEDLH
jgi:hypothetical protein